MNELWVEIKTGQKIAVALGMPSIDEAELDALLFIPGCEEFIRTEVEAPEVPDGTLAMQILRTRYFFNVTACKKVGGDVAIAFMTFATTQSMSTTAMVGLGKKIASNLKRLSHEEVSAVRAIIQACPGDPYKTRVPESDVTDAFEGTDEELDDLLDSLQSKGVIRGKRRNHVMLVL